MGDRLHQELLAVNGLENVTSLQLQDLPWKTREQILIALFQEHASSVAVADELRSIARDRRLERKTEKAENADRDTVRKSEDRYRSEYMQITAKELSRLGAPTMITWQKLIFDKECCTQAFRLLLTKIKSSRRSGSSSNSGSIAPRRPVTLAKRFITTDDQGEENDDGGDDESNRDGSAYDRETSPPSPATDRGLPRIGPTSVMKKPSRSASISSGPTAGPQWNSDTSVNQSTDRFEMDREVLNTPTSQRERFGGSDMTIQRTKANPNMASSTSSFASKLKKSQLQSLQQENLSCAKENEQLRSEIAHLEALVATLQANNNQAPPDGIHDARMKLLQAQNMQLHRQIALLQDAILEREMAESMLMTALSHWKEVVEGGRQEAKSAGADGNAKTQDGKPVQWMLAVPDRLLDELVRVESQIQHASKTMSIAHESKLRIGGVAAEFLRNGSSSVSLNDVYVPGVGHLRVDRVKALEQSLVDSVRALEKMYDRFEQTVIPTISTHHSDTYDSDTPSTSTRSQLDATLTCLRRTMLEVGAFGVVVPRAAGSQRLSQADGNPLLTVSDVQRAYVAANSTSSGISAKDRDKQLKAMLKQLQASESAMERDNQRLTKEVRYWKHAWTMQEEILHTLIQRVRRVGDKKLQWIETHIVQCLVEIHEVWTSFIKAQNQQNDQRIHKNAYLPLLIDTLHRHAPSSILEAIDQWQPHASKMNEDIDSLLSDYLANCQMLRGLNSEAPSRLG